jgi:hypothetical protein
VGFGTEENSETLTNHQVVVHEDNADRLITYRNAASPGAFREGLTHLLIGFAVACAARAAARIAHFAVAMLNQNVVLHSVHYRPEDDLSMNPTI